MPFITGKSTSRTTRSKCRPFSNRWMADAPSAYYRLGELAEDPEARVAFDSSGACRNGAIAANGSSAAGAVPSDEDAAVSSPAGSS